MIIGVMIIGVMIIGVIKTQFFHIVMYVFDNSNLSQEIFAIDTWRAVICSLGYGRKHMLKILPTIWRPGFKEYLLRCPCEYVVNVCIL